MSLEQSRDLASWPFEQFFWPFTSFTVCRIVELLPKVLWLLSKLPWNLISRCTSPSNLMFQYFILRNVAWTVKTFGFLTVQAIFSTSYLIYRMENGWTAVQSALILSQLTWILISGCISPSNLLLSFIWRNVARTVKRFGFLTVLAKSWLLRTLQVDGCYWVG